MGTQVQITNDHQVSVTVATTPVVNVSISRTSIGTVANVTTANYANYAGNAVVANSANSVTLSNVAGAGNIASINLNGNSLSLLDGTGSWVAIPSTANANYANYAGIANISNVAYSVSGSNVVGFVGNATFATTAAVANSVAGSNVTGTVANANYATTAGSATVANTANSVTVGNVVGIGNIATTNYNGNGNSLLAGNGAWIAVPNTAVANYANYAGNATIANTANSVAGSNVTGTVANANYAAYAGNATIANTANVANTANSVAVANVVGIGNIATVNLDGNVSNALLGDGTWGPVELTTANYANFAGEAFSVAGANVTGTVANATYALDAGNATTAGTANSVAGANVTGSVANANYSNIAGVSYSVSGSNVSGIVANANYAAYSNVANVANSVNAANISGTVANANYAAYAGNATIANSANSVAVANVSGIGNIATINLNGNNQSLLDGTGNWVAVPNTAVANYANYAGNATIANTANSVAGANVTGVVANATYATTAGSATTAGTVTTNSQPNITSVGTLTDLTVSGNITANVINANYVNANFNMANVDSLYFDTSAGITPNVVGQLAWDDGDGTLAMQLKGNNVTLQIGEEQVARVYNADSVTLNLGDVVYVYGAQGNRIAVKRAQANSESTSVGTIGIVGETITAGSEGFVIVSGTLGKLNTLGYTAGATVYLSPSTPGGWTTTKPIAPDQLVVLGWIERVHAAVGSIYIKVDNGYELEELHDVLIANVQPGQALIWDTNVWINGNPNYANISGTSYSVAGANVSGTVANANYAAYAGNATIANSANSVAGANVTGQVANANIAYNSYISSTPPSSMVPLTGAISSNITGFPGEGSLTTFGNVFVNTSNSSLTAQNINTGNLDVVGTITGNGSGLSNIAGANVTGTVANATYALNAGNATVASSANSVAGANVSGTVANATYAVTAGTANSVAVANVVGIGNIATINLNANSSTILDGTGNWVAVPSTANANYANYAGNAFSVAGANVSGQVSFAAVANSVAVANVSGIGNIAITNYNGNGSQVLAGNGAWVAQTGGGGTTSVGFEQTFLLMGA